MSQSEGFPAVDAVKELNPGMNKDFQVDPISSNLETLKEKEVYEAAKKVKDDEKKADALQNFITALIVSGVVVAVAGAVFAITKKLREK